MSGLRDNEDAPCHFFVLQEGSRCVFVPGPHDPGLGSILPQPRLPTYFTSELQAVLPYAVFATNPCR
jgi:DNA polymerase epsilon subunit 2